MFKKVLYIAVSVLLVTSLTSAQNYLDEDIDEDLTLNPVAYIVRAQTEGDGIIEIIDNATLTISPGCTLQFMPERSIFIDGGSALTASGTAVSPIIFTSNSDPQAAGDWGQIIFAGDNAVDVATGTFSNCIFEYGGNEDDDTGGFPDGAAVMVAGFADLTVEYSTVRYCEGTALGVNYGNTLDPVTVCFQYNDIYHCNSGIKICDHDASSITVEGNNIIKPYRESGDADGDYSGIGILINSGTIYTDLYVKNNSVAYASSHGVITNDINEFYNNTIIHSMLCGFVYNGVVTVTDHFKNNIVYGFSEQAGIDSVGVYARTAMGAENCCVYDPAAVGFYNVTPTDTIRTLPGLIDTNGFVPEDLDLHLMFSSLCLHSGDSTAAADTNLNGTHIDMGAYGGIKARDYYMGVTGTLPDGGSITGEKGSPFYVTGEVILPAGDEFEIASAAEDLVFEHGPSAKWTILGDLNIRGISNSVNDSRVNVQILI